MHSYLKINRDNLVHNLQEFRKIIGPQDKLAAVVKADAYGHGTNIVVPAVDDHVDMFAVDDIDELVEVSALTSKPILVLGYVEPSRFGALLDYHAIPTISDLHSARSINDLVSDNGPKEIHLLIDAGFGRQGILVDGLADFLDSIAELDKIKITGILAHFSSADSIDQSRTKWQLELFQRALDICNEKGYSNLTKHILATAGTINFKSQSGYGDIVRMGIGLYGQWPSKFMREKFTDTISFKPVLSWHTEVALVKDLPADYPVGYGATYITEGVTRVAIIPQGYSDGYMRSLSNKADVLIRGRRCKVIGQISMNMMVVNVTDHPDVTYGDEVVLIGSQGQEEISAGELARHAGTISYEVLTMISMHIPRVAYP